MELSSAPIPRTETISRRTVLRRFGRRAGVLATAGAGMLEFAGVSDAASMRRRRGGGHIYASVSTGAPIIVTDPTANPASCQCTGQLAEGHCPGGPCPPGFYCYEVDYCGGATTKYACLNCEGTPTCSYDCS